MLHTEMVCLRGNDRNLYLVVSAVLSQNPNPSSNGSSSHFSLALILFSFAFNFSNRKCARSSTHTHTHTQTHTHTHTQAISRRLCEIKAVSSNQNGGRSRRGEGGETREDTKNETENSLINSSLEKLAIKHITILCI